MIRAALAYARKGLQIFPCQPRAKRPATANGLKDATTDPDRIRAWWHQEPAFNVAVATGAVSGIFVVDVDGWTPRLNFANSKRNMARFPPQSRPLPHAAGTSISR
jgi:Bifunctional DNA primase/polymerase, N-terminal.